MKGPYTTSAFTTEGIECFEPTRFTSLRTARQHAILSLPFLIADESWRNQVNIYAEDGHIQIIKEEDLADDQ